MDLEHAIIDDERLESEFDDLSGQFDKFAYILVCDPHGQFHSAVPYMYAKNITRVRESLVTVPISEYPDLERYSVGDELLKLTCLNPLTIVSLVDRQDQVVPNLHAELRELESLEMLDERSADSLNDKLKLFLKTISVGHSDGSGIAWIPQNYGGQETDQEQQDNEETENYMRRIICSHIKHRRLPMARIIPVSPERMNMMNDLISSLSNYDTNAIKAVGRSHFAPILRNRSDISEETLKTLMAEEFRCIKNNEYVDGDSPFIFNNSQLDMSGVTIRTDSATENLRYYVGLYLDELDLTQSFITGSSITASLFRTRQDNSYRSENKTLTTADHRCIMIDLLYPTVITHIDPEHAEMLRDESISLWNINAISETDGIVSKGNTHIPFTIKGGSDVDIGVDETVSDDEYRRIAQGHFNVISFYHPYVKMKEYVKPKGDWNYAIYTDDPQYIPIFRTVEIYRTSFRNICSHHVGAVRGCYTARFSDRPQFYLAASGVMTSMHKATPNYHYFAGKKSNPQDIIIKNKQRGIDILDEVLAYIIGNYISNNSIETSHLPFYLGKNVPYSIFVAPIEYTFAQKEIREKREREARSRERQARELEKRAALEIREQQRKVLRKQEEETLKREQAERARLRSMGYAQTSYDREHYIASPVATPTDVQRMMSDERERALYLSSLGLPKVNIPTETRQMQTVPSPSPSTMIPQIPTIQHPSAMYDNDSDELIAAIKQAHNPELD